MQPADLPIGLLEEEGLLAGEEGSTSQAKTSSFPRPLLVGVSAVSAACGVAALCATRGMASSQHVAVTGIIGESASGGDCSKHGESCADTQCCSDPGYTCYVKNQHWSMCNKTCDKFMHWKDDGWKREETEFWSCEVLGTAAAPPGDEEPAATEAPATEAPAATEAPTTTKAPAATEAPATEAPASGGESGGACSTHGEDCAETKCCAVAGYTCYRKNQWWAACNKTCDEYMHWIDDGWQRAPIKQWTCEVLGTPAAPVPEAPEALTSEEEPAAAPAPASSGGGSGGGESRGETIEAKMTMWSLRDDVIVGSTIKHEGGPSACFFADPKQGGLKSPAATSPYIPSRMYCAADIETLFEDGKACGRCYKIKFGGAGGTDGGRAGEAVIQVVNSGHMAHGAAFDCQVDAFEAITGARTGVYPITYEEVTCDTSSGGGVATVLAGGNAWYTKVVFSNMRIPPVAVTFEAGGNSYEMEMASCCGYFQANPKGETGPVKFKVTHEDGSESVFEDCFSEWPVPDGSACHQGSR